MAEMLLAGGSAERLKMTSLLFLSVIRAYSY
jgi:hypothetical protein